MGHSASPLWIFALTLENCNTERRSGWVGQFTLTPGFKIHEGIKNKKLGV